MESLEHTLVVSRLILGVLATLVVLVFAGKRVLWLTKLISSGQKVGDERGRKDHLVQRFLNQNKEVFAQSKLLKWSIPGIAHFFTMWGFFVLATVYLGPTASCSTPNSISRSSAAGPCWASCRTSSPSPCWRHHRLRDHPHPQEPRAARP